MNEYDVACDELRDSLDTDAAVESWLRSDVMNAYGELVAGSLQPMSSAEIRVHLAELHKQRVVERDP